MTQIKSINIFFFSTGGNKFSLRLIFSNEVKQHLTSIAESEIGFASSTGSDSQQADSAISSNSVLQQSSTTYQNQNDLFHIQEFLK